MLSVGLFCSSKKLHFLQRKFMRCNLFKCFQDANFCVFFLSEESRTENTQSQVLLLSAVLLFPLRTMSAEFLNLEKHKEKLSDLTSSWLFFCCRFEALQVFGKWITNYIQLPTGKRGTLIRGRMRMTVSHIRFFALCGVTLAII